MKVSIITVVLNNKDGLERTMESVFIQTYLNYEYIIVDGGSNDGTVDVIKKNEDKLLYWVSEPDTGIYNAMNKGWRMATGDYCIFLNSGDYFYTQDSLKNALNEFDNDMHIMYGDVMFKYENKMKREVHEDTMSLYKLTYTNIPHQGTFIKRDFLAALNGYDENYKIISDWLFLVKATIENDLKMKKIDQVISVFDMYGISSTQKSDHERAHAINTYYPFLNSIFKDFYKLRKYELSSAHKLVKIIVNVKDRLTGKSRGHKYEK